MKMLDQNAIQIAVDVYKQPLLMPRIKNATLPKGMLSVIKLAAGENLIGPTEEENSFKRDASVFFLQQILSSASNNNYRQLGLEPGASIEMIREHRRWLLKWLHPDRNHNKWESRLFRRVNEAAHLLEQQVGASTAVPALMKKGPDRRRNDRAAKTFIPRTTKTRLQFKVIFRKAAIFAIVSGIATYLIMMKMGLVNHEIFLNDIGFQ